MCTDKTGIQFICFVDGNTRTAELLYNITHLSVLSYDYGIPVF